MAATKYTYALSSFTSGLNVDRFTDEVRDSTILIALDHIDVNAPDVDVWFKDALSGGDQTTLTGLVSAHTGTPPDDAPIQVTVTINEDVNHTITGVHTYDRANGGVIILPAGTAFPSSPVEGEFFWRSDQNKLYRRQSAAWVEQAAAVTSVFGRTGAVTAQSGDYTAAQVGADPSGTAVSLLAGHVVASDPHGGYQLESEKGAASGYAPLDSAALVPAGNVARRLLQFIDDGPAEGFASGAYKETLPSADPFPTSYIWWTSAAKTHKLVELTVTRNTNKTPTTEEWKLYAADGTTVLVTATDAISYSGIFETTRTRVVS